MKNKTFAIEAAPSAIPPNPNIAAMIAITKKITDQRNIILVFKVRMREYCRLLYLPDGTLVPAFLIEIFVPTLILCRSGLFVERYLRNAAVTFPPPPAFPLY